MNERIRRSVWIALVAVALSGGCASPTAAPGPAQVFCPEGVATTQAMEAAHAVLAGMHFPIEKLDVEQGVIKTRPLRAAQFFEFWRSDNVGAFNTVEANVQSIRRTVELRVRRRAVDHKPQAAGAPRLSIECDVQVQRLALPGNEIAGISQAYQIHTRSEATLQVLNVTPQQRAGMAWINLGPDPQLAAEILRRIERKLEH
jgi:hypothetical protein